MSGLLKMNEDEIEKLVNKLLEERLDSVSYNDTEVRFFVVSDDTLLIKLYTEKQLIFTIKTRLVGDALEVIDVN